VSVPCAGWTVETLHLHLMELLNGHVRTRSVEVDALKELLEARLNDFKTLVAAQKDANEKALQRSQEIESYNKEQVNEWGAALRNLSSTFAASAIVDRLEADLKRLELAQTGSVSKADLNKIYSDIERLRDAAATDSGKSQITSQIVTNGISILAILVVVGVAIFETSRNSPPAPPPVAIVQPITPNGASK